MPQSKIFVFFLLCCVSLLVTATTADKDALFKAVQDDDAKSIKEQLEGDDLKGDNLMNSIGQGGQTPLMHAVLTGKVNAAKILLELGADTTIGEKDGYTPLHGAGFQGRAEIAKALLDFGLDPLERHKDGFLPLHRACWGREERHTETVKVFMEHLGGVPSDYKASNGKTCHIMTRNKGTSKLLSKYEKKAKEEL